MADPIDTSNDAAIAQVEQEENSLASRELCTAVACQCYKLHLPYVGRMEYSFQPIGTHRILDCILGMHALHFVLVPYNVKYAACLAC